MLIYVGFCNPKWNREYSITNALGGSEKAVIQLCTHFTKEYSIIISGDIIPETIPGIQFIDRFDLPKDSQFDMVIVSRYVSFFTIFFRTIARRIQRVLRKNGIKLYHCPAAIVNLDNSSSRSSGLKSLIKIFFSYSRIMMRFAKFTGSNRLRLFTFLILHHVILILRKFRLWILTFRNNYFVFQEVTMGQVNEVILFWSNLTFLIEIINKH